MRDNKPISYLVTGIVFMFFAFVALYALLQGMATPGAGALIR